jgi:hypothetical protein
LLADPIRSARQTELAVVDATFLIDGDVLEIIDPVTGDAERVLMDGDPLGPNTIKVTRGLWSQIRAIVGTTPLAWIAASAVVSLIGNSHRA